MPTSLQIMSQVELVEEPNVEPIKEVITQPITRNQENVEP